MDIVIKIGQLLLALSILIVLHELGHFLFARLFKVRVEKFFLFFDAGFSLFKVKKGDTEYGIGWLPLGGYVKISGMIDESLDKEQMKKPPQPYEFRSKPAWQRLLIMLGGVIVNLILGFLIYSFILFTWGERYLPNKNLSDGIWVIDTVMYQTGLQTGDKILSINNVEPVSFQNVFEEIIYGGTMIVERNGEKVQLEIPEDFIGQLADHRIKNDGLLLYPRIPFIVREVIDSLHNATSGLQAKDRIIAVNGHSIKYFDEYRPLIDTLKNRSVILTVDREGKKEDIRVKIDENGMLGIEYAILSYTQLEKLGIYDLETREFSFLQSIPAGFIKAKETLQKYLRQLKLIVNIKSGAHKGIGGFGAIAGLFPPVWDWENFWVITAFLSIMLAVLNLLPIPALDGGHVTFLLFEIITGRKPGEKFLEYAQIVGMVILLMLLVYANGNDIYRWILRAFGN